MDYNTAIFDLNNGGSHNMASFINRCKRVFDDINFYNFSEDGWSFLVCVDRPLTKDTRNKVLNNVFNLRYSLDIFTNGTHIENNHLLVIDELDSDITCDLKSLSVVNKRAFGTDNDGNYYNLLFASGYNEYHLIKFVATNPEAPCYNEITEFINETVGTMGREMRTDTIRNKQNGDEFIFAINADINSYHYSLRDDIINVIQIVSTGFMHDNATIHYPTIKKTLEENNFSLVLLSEKYVEIKDEIGNIYKFLHGVYNDGK